MIRDNLKKGSGLNLEDCTFCSKDETITHFFHECIVAKEIWRFASNLFGAPLGSNFVYLSKF
jgi:hypothetical protein